MGDLNDPFMRNNNSAAAAQARTKVQNRTNVMQLKLIGQSHPTGLTTNLLKLFEPRPPLEFKPPPEKRKLPSYTGMAQFVSSFAEKGDPEYQPPVKVAETPAQKRARIHQSRLEKGAKKAAEELEKYDPNNDPNISGDPYKTLFVAKLSYETTESKIKREFEAYGPIKRVRLVTDKETNKPRGYAFVEFMHTRDMKAAYKQADGRKLDNRRVLVDVERGRTVPNWRPRRLGGGLGTSRVGVDDVNPKHSGRDREKSRERGRDREREREKSRDRSHDRPREREHREDRHHRGRDRTRDKDRAREVRDRDRRDRGRDRGRDYERDRDRGRDRTRERDYGMEDVERERGRSHDREYDYDRVDSKHDRVRHGGDKDRSYDHGEADDDRGGHYEYYDQRQVGGHYDDDDTRGEQKPYDHMEEDNYGRD